MKKKLKLINRDNFSKVFSIIILVSWCLIIFYFSSQKGNLSESNSDSIIELLNKILQIFNKNVDISRLQYISFLIRKFAHLFLYFVLYLLIYYCFFKFDIKKRYLIILFCFLYAISDEIHQLFVPGRSFQVIDILIDTFGSFLACFMLIFKDKLRKTCKSQ